MNGRHYDRRALEKGTTRHIATAPRESGDPRVRPCISFCVRCARPRGHWRPSDKLVIIAVTGATGFVGSNFVAKALAAGTTVRALTRAPRDRVDVDWVVGTLDDTRSLEILVDGADALVHIAGVVNAPDRAGFAATNVEGTRNALAAVGKRRFVHVSSLAAREPALSDYGWSKSEAERLVEASACEWTIVRPPAIYGPGDLDQLDLFRMIRLGFALLPPPGRFSLIAADDLATLLLRLSMEGAPRQMFEADDGTDGWSHADYARMIGHALGRRVLPLPLPRRLLAIGAGLDRLLRGPRARLTPDRVAYFSHPDWTIDPSRRPPPSLWTPGIPLAAGLADTVRWYRAHHLL